MSSPARRCAITHVRCACTGLLALGITTAVWPRQASETEYGPTPSLGAPEKSLLSTVHTAKAIGWPAGGRPTAAAGTQVTALARDLDHPRWLYVLPNGDVLVAESDAPPKPDDAKGITGRVRKLVMKRAGSGTRPSADRITLLRDTGGSAPERHVFIEGLHSPIGMALVGESFYVADSDALLRFSYHTGDTEIRSQPIQVASLPAGRINHHWTKSLIASPDGGKLYVGVGSNSNAAENGLAVEAERSSVWEIDPKTGDHRIFASGLRNPVGLAWEPESGALWVAVNERDGLGDHLPPDYMTAVHEGAFYGWPFSYYGSHVDARVQPQNPDAVAKAVSPDYALGAHTASLGLCWSADAKMPAQFQHGMFVGQHGSWNRKIRSGYKVVFVQFAGGEPTGPPIDLLTGFLDSKGRALGRPVGVAIDKRGALLVADDVGGAVWRVTGTGEGVAAAANRR